MTFRHATEQEMESYWFVGETHHVGTSLIAEITPSGSREGDPTRLISVDQMSNSWLGAEAGGSYLFVIDGELFPSRILEDGKVGIEVAVA